MDNQEKRTKWLHVRLSEDEEKAIDAQMKLTTTVRKSDFARAQLLKKPLIGSYRNRSMDDMMSELLRLRKELNQLGNNFNQAVHKLHLVDTIAELRAWLNTYDGTRLAVAKKVEEIRLFIGKMGDQWLR